MMYLEHIHCHPQILSLTRLPPCVSLKGTALAKDRENSIIQNLGAEPIKHFFKLLIKNAINTSHLALSYLSGSAE